MTDYDFHTLNDKEFEHLVADLLSIREGATVERFKPGKDSGVDGRFFSTDNSEVIIQCKHWPNAGLAALIRSLPEEAKKAKKLNCPRYIFCTCLPLSRSNKKRIKKIFDPYIKSESDILGNEDLNTLIANSPDIEQRHYKLWFASTTVLQTILNAGIIARSEYTIREISDAAAKYVQTRHHEAALKQIESLHTLIISGDPGIGKTTLANQLFFYYSGKGFNAYVIHKSIDEAEEVFTPKKKQVFYFDDFLGTNYLEALRSFEDSATMAFIKTVSRSPNTRFLLTSRTHILNREKQLSESYRNENVERNEYEIQVASLSDIEKAKILYNHIWFSDLETEYIDELYKDDKYLEIIKHRNYIPRLIAFITDAYKIRDIAPPAYWNYITTNLDNPSEIWSKVYDDQISTEAQLLVCLTVLNGGTIHDDRLFSAFRHLALSLDLARDTDIRYKYNQATRLVTGAMLNRKSKSDSVSFDLFNPAVGDFILKRTINDPDALSQYYLALDTPESINTLGDLFNVQDSKATDLILVIKKLVDMKMTNDNRPESADYFVALGSLARAKLSGADHLAIVRSKCNSIAYNQVTYKYDEYASSLILWALELGEQIEDAIIMQHLKSAMPSAKEVEHTNTLYRIIGSIHDAEARADLTDELCEFVATNFEEDINQDVYFNDIIYDYLDKPDDASEAVQDYLMSILDDMEFELSQEQIDSILDAYDYDIVFDRHSDDFTPDAIPQREEFHTSPAQDSTLSAIKDLFERQK